MRKTLGIAVLVLFCWSFPATAEAQQVPTVKEVQNFFNNTKKLVTYREGEVIYGTYYFLEIHYCPSGHYGLYGHSVKKTVLGNEQRNNWQEFGTWKVTEQQGTVGLFYTTASGQQNFIPIYKYGNGSYSSGEGITIVNKGPAICM